MLSELSADLLAIHADLALAIFHNARGAHDKARVCMQDASDNLHSLRDGIAAQEAHEQTAAGDTFAFDAAREHWTVEERLQREG